MTAPTQQRRLGKNSRLYYSATWATPTWVRIDTRDTLNVKNSKSLEDVTAEDSAGEMWQQPILNQRGIEGTLFSSSSADTAIDALKTAYEAGTPLTFAVSNGDITTSGTKYRMLELYVTQFDENHDVKSPVKATFALTPGPIDPAHAPVTNTVSGS